jgi:hypothetical protein
LNGRVVASKPHVAPVDGGVIGMAIRELTDDARADTTRDDERAWMDW